MPSNAADRLALTAAAIAMHRRYWLDVFPRVRDEQRRWSLHIAKISSLTLRQAALAAQHHKRGNPQGAAAFATLAPAQQRPPLVRGLVAFQTMYDYLDTLSERPEASSPANVRQLHGALLSSLTGRIPEADYYALYPARDDGGYLRDLVTACRRACVSLPAYPTVADRLGRFAQLIIDYQGIVGASSTRIDAAAGWAHQFASTYPELRWWEIAAAAGSSLPVFALLAAAADPATRTADVAAIERAYFPGIAALHSLLDGLIDQTEDALAGHHNLVSQYGSERESADRLSELARRAAQLARELPHGRVHVAILSAMASYYLATAEASHPQVRQARRGILTALGAPTTPALLIFRGRRLATFVERVVRRRRALI